MTWAYETDHGRLYHGDCLDLLKQVPTDSVDLVFADPPFNLGKDYGKGVSDKYIDDEYVDWCRAWVSECYRVAAPGASLFFYNLPKWNIPIANHLNDLGAVFRHWIAVDIKFGLPIRGRLYPSHYSLLYYSKGKPKAFTRPRVPIQVCRHCGGDIKDYGGHRNKLHPDGINLSDVWSDIPPVRHKGTKHRGANQLSPKLLERVLTIGSEEGDLVLDPFGGAGTTYFVAEQMHRRWIGSELGDITSIVKRLEGEPTIYEPPNRGDAGNKVQVKSDFVWDKLL
jgi:site-specific DNA-methyltransferase (adenine-specific)